MQTLVSPVNFEIKSYLGLPFPNSAIVLLTIIRSNYSIKRYIISIKSFIKFNERRED